MTKGGSRVGLVNVAALPRSAKLATWGTAWLKDDADLDDVVKRVEGADEPHDAVGVPGTSDHESLTEALTRLRAAGATALRVVLPVPGDPIGLGGPPEFNADAIDAGEALIVDGAAYGLIPDIRAFGPPGDQGYFVTWNCQPAAQPSSTIQLADADQELSLALLSAGDILEKLDVSAWQPEVATLLQDLRSGQIGEPLPRAFSGRAQTTAARGSRVLAIVNFALNDDGGAVSATTAQSRRDALTPLARAARHALVAACNSLAEPR